MSGFTWKAMDMAYHAHNGQTRKDGSSVFQHAHRVVEMCPDDTHTCAVAWMHDVVEDSDKTVTDIREVFGDVVADAVDAISRREDEPYFDYIRRCKQNDIARQVKLFDLTDNNQPDQLRDLGEEGLIDRCMTAVAILISDDTNDIGHLIGRNNKEKDDV